MRDEPPGLSSQVTRDGEPLLIWCREERRGLRLPAEVAQSMTDPSWSSSRSLDLRGLRSGAASKLLGSGQLFDEL